jgi:phosphonate transport system substrate-binding protein
MFQMGKRAFSFVQALILLAILAIVAVSCTPVAPAATPAANKATNQSSVSPTTDPKAGWPKEFIVGFFAGDDPNKVLESNEPLRAHLEKSLGIPVKSVTGTSYSAVIEAMRNKKADAMEVGPFSYTLAVQEANAEALAAGISVAKGKEAKYDASIPPYYYSLIFTMKGSGIKTIADLKGKDFNFVDPASTSGHLMPKTYLIKSGIDPDKDMKTVFAGSHPTSVISVWNKKAAAGATYEQNLFDLVANNQVEACLWPDKEINKKRTAEEIKAVYDACPDGKLVIIGMTDPIPNTPFAVRADLPASFKMEVKNALLSVKDKPELITAYRGWYVDPSVSLKLANLDAFYNPLRDIAKLLNLDLKAMK